MGGLLKVAPRLHLRQRPEQTVPAQYSTKYTKLKVNIDFFTRIPLRPGRGTAQDRDFA